jgi:hypothetical protein
MEIAFNRIPCGFITLLIKYFPETSLFNIHSSCHFMSIVVSLSFLSAIPFLTFTQ